MIPSSTLVISEVIAWHTMISIPSIEFTHSILSNYIVIYTGLGKEFIATVYAITVYIFFILPASRGIHINPASTTSRFLCQMEYYVVDTYYISAKRLAYLSRLFSVTTYDIPLSVCIVEGPIQFHVIYTIYIGIYTDFVMGKQNLLMYIF